MKREIISPTFHKLITIDQSIFAVLRVFHPNLLDHQKKSVGKGFPKLEKMCGVAKLLVQRSCGGEEEETV